MAEPSPPSGASPVTRRRTVGHTGVEVTELGFGGGPLGELFSRVDDAQARQTLVSAWDAGVRYFDTSPWYGRGLSEHRVGDFVREVGHGAVLSTKVGRMLVPTGDQPSDDPMWTNTPPMRIAYDYSYDGTLRSIDDSLQRMLTDRIDIALIHDCDRYGHGDNQPAVFDQAMSQAARALLDLRDQGVLGAVGIGVNEADVCVAAAERMLGFERSALLGRPGQYTTGSRRAYRGGRGGAAGGSLGAAVGASAPCR